MSHVLIVEDDPAFRYAAEKALGEAGFGVTVAQSYLSALQVLNGDREVDLLLTDLVMQKGVNGFALARMARMRRRDLKILYVTAYPDLPMDEALGKVIHKPISGEELVEEVRGALAS